jgi:hypothetical protein
MKPTKRGWIAVGYWVEHEDDNIPDICTCNVADLGQEGRSEKEMAANAMLCSAAHELADVAAWVVQEYESIGSIPDGLYNSAKAALRKAGK